MIAVNPGDRIEMILMTDDPCPIEPGDVGTVMWISDLGCMGGCYKGQHQIAVKWDSGRTLSLIAPKDKFKVLRTAEVSHVV